MSGFIGRHRDHGGLIFLDVRDASGVVQVVIDPSRCARGARRRARHARWSPWCASRATWHDARPRPSTRASRPARSSCAARVRGAVAGRRAAVPARRRGRRRDAPHPPPRARPAPRRDDAAPAHARPRHADHAPPPRGPRVPRPRDADARPSRRPRARATSWCPARLHPARSTRCRRARSCSSSSDGRAASSGTTRSPAASATRPSAPTASWSSRSSTSRWRSSSADDILDLIEGLYPRSGAR